MTLTRELGRVLRHVGQHKLISICDDKAMTKHLNDGPDEAVGRAVELGRVRSAVNRMHRSVQARTV